MNPFAACIKRVEEWLPSTGFVRDPGKRRTWKTVPSEGYFEGEIIRLVLPETFPSRTAELYIDPKYFLKLPHVEGDGKICLNSSAIPEDYEDPIEAVKRVLFAFENSWFKTTTGDVSYEFHKERIAYWGQYQETARKKFRRWQPPTHTFVELAPFEGWAEGEAVRHIQKGNRQKHSSCQVATAKPGADAALLASRHGFNVGSLVKGKALFIQLPLEFHWTPQSWPRRFEELASLVSRLTVNQVDLKNWVIDSRPGSPKARKIRQSKKCQRNLALRRERPLLIFFVQEQALFGYQILSSSNESEHQIPITPFSPDRIDASWALARDHETERLTQKQNKRVLVIGCGSLGSPVIELLARSGVGHLDILDKERFEVPNVSRHILGIRAVDVYKAKALSHRLLQEVPGIQVRPISASLAVWFASHGYREKYDLIVECTGESSVRTLVSHWREHAFGGVPVIHAWLEPYCSAAHVVLSQTTDPWPCEDPADTKINIASFSGTDHKVMLPACNSGFYPYGPTDVWGAASFVAERSLEILESPSSPSSVWSWIRSKAFYESLPVQPKIHDEQLLASGGKLDKKTIERNYFDTLEIVRPLHG